MIKRTKIATAVITGLGAAGLLRDANRRAKAAKLVIRTRDAVLRPRPPVVVEGDVAHAPGHRHLPPPETYEPPADAQHGTHTVVSHHAGHVHKG